MEYREFEIRSVNTELRQVTGLAVPYGQTTDIGDYLEQIERGAFGTPESVPLFYGHNHRFGGMPIGEVTAYRDTDAGLEIDASLFETSGGEDAYTLLKNKTIKKFSIGFQPVEQRVSEDGTTVTRTKADLKEVSIVWNPAYDGADVSNVRSDERGQATQNSEEEVIELTTNEVTEVAEVRERMDDLERKLAGLQIVETASARSSFRSAGELVMAARNGDDEAKKVLTRAYTGATSADSHTGNDWHSALLQIVNHGRPLVNLFGHDTLGSSGMTVTYPKISALTGDVAVQAAEGDDLAYIEVGITEASAPVKTYGAYSELSRQAIERSDVPYLQKALEYQAASYAKITNGLVRTAVTGATPQTGTSFTLSTADGAKFQQAVVDGRQKIYKNGQGASAEFVIVSGDVWLQMAALVDGSGRPLFAVNGDGVNTLGNINQAAFTGTISGLPVIYDEGLAVKTMFIASSAAVTLWEPAGVPFRIDVDQPKNLTHLYALYGYNAVAATNELGLVKPTIA